MENNIIKEKKPLFDKAIDHLKNEISSIRTGRADPSLVENLMVNYYGVKTPLLQLASITAPDQKSMVIQPWDKNCMKDVESAVNGSNLGLRAINEGNLLRIVIPALSEERRKELVKLLHTKLEAGRVAVRNIREEIWKESKEMKKNSEITEDDLFNRQKEVQKLLDDYNQTIKEIGDKKEKEIMTI